MGLFCRSLLIAILLLAGFAHSNLLDAQQSSLKILYVGESPDEQSKLPRHIPGDQADGIWS